MIPATLDALLERVDDFAAGRLPGQSAPTHAGTADLIFDLAESLMRLRDHKRALLDLARQYARTCGDCAGTRVRPDGRPCDACHDITRVIDQVEGRT